MLPKHPSEEKKPQFFFIQKLKKKKLEKKIQLMKR